LVGHPLIVAPFSNLGPSAAAILGVERWLPWRWPLRLQRIIFVAMTSFFEFALMLVIPAALLILLAALLLTRST
jgi:hypothetical protein